MASHGSQPFLEAGRALDAALKAAGFTGRDLASQLKVDDSRVSKWRNGHERVPDDKVAPIERLLNADLSALHDAPAAVHYEMYVAAPITGLAPADIEPHHDAIAMILEKVEPLVDGLYWPGREIRSRSDLLAPALTTERNLRVMQHCRAFLYLQFRPLSGPSGSLVELGLALGRQMRTTVFMAPKLEMPFMLKGFEGVAGRINFLPDARVYNDYKPSEAAHFIEVNQRPIFGL
jgi:transcriptional regulator with XRE-family HTH domain